MNTILQNRKSVTRLIFALLMAFIFLVPAMQAQSLVGWWKMDEGSGTTLVDASSSGNNGTIVNSPTWISGVIDSALSINPGVTTNQFARVPNSTSLNLLSGITLSAWIKPIAQATQYILKKGFSDSPGSAHVAGYELSLASSGTVFFRLNQSPILPLGYRVDSNTPYPSDGNTWMHVAASYDGTTIRIYINGILENSVAGPTSIAQNDSILGIGTQSFGSVNRFKGALDDARVYDYALDGTSILALATVLPTVPVLRAPADGTPNLTIPVTIRWYAAASAASYQLQISTTADFSNPPFPYDQSGITTLTNLISGLPENTQLYWRVRATNTVGTSGWSTVWDFTTSVALASIVSTGSGFALNLNGNAGNYTAIPDNNTLDLTSALTIEAWIRPNSPAATQRLIRKGASGYQMFLSSAQQVAFQNLSTGKRINSTTPYPIDGTWMHIAGTFGSGVMKLYINGIQEGGDSLSGNFVINGAELRFGANSASPAIERYNGVIDEIRLWNVARTETGIRDNMCKKLTGSESGLIGYWRFDETSGDNFSDETTNNFTATIVRSSGAEHVWSGANVGDVSINDYDATGGYTLNFPSGDGDDITATITTGTGIQAYRVDEDALRPGTNPPSGWNAVDPLRYWGVKAIGSGATYDIVYNYDGHPGLGTEADLRLAKRNGLSDNWVDASAVLNEGANTLTLTGQTGTEYSLGSITAPLPVELSAFSASVTKTTVKLKWRTETEVSNYGFEVQRSVKNNNWEVLGFVAGNGNSNSPKDYSFTDDNVTSGKYSYRLKQIDTDGQFSYSKTIEVNFGSAVKFELSQNYPNPFNPVTTIQFSIPQSSNVKLTVYNILGEQVAELINGFRDAGVHTVNFDAGQFNSGLYIYKIESNGMVQTRKMLLVK